MFYTIEGRGEITNTNKMNITGHSKNNGEYVNLTPGRALSNTLVFNVGKRKLRSGPSALVEDVANYMARSKAEAGEGMLKT